MKADAIVYTSGTGHTQQYAQFLGALLGLPVFPLSEASSQLSRGSTVIYLGWISASHIKGFAKASKRFDVCIVCGVGLCDTGTMTDEVRRVSGVPSEIPLFTLQGGIDKSRLGGAGKLVISALTKGLSEQKTRTAQEDRMLELLLADGNYVSEENLSALLELYRNGEQ